MKQLAMLVALLAALVSPALSATVYSSSHTVTADTAAQLTPQRGVLYKVIVSSAGSTNALVTVSNGGTALATLDASAQRDFEYNVIASSGLYYTTAGTTPAQVTFLYRRNLPPHGTDEWSSVNYTSNQTTTGVMRGRGILKRVVIGKAGAGGAVTLYDGYGTSTGRVIDIIQGDNVRNVEYNVMVSSGITVTSTGSTNVTVVYGTPR